jgi:hypothetical protein
MSVLQYITSPVHGCCTTSELMALSKANKKDMEDLKEYARAEMKNKGIEITVS